MNRLKTPIAFFIYKRPESTQQVFDCIRAVRPEQLYIIADGPAKGCDESKVLTARKITEKIDWPCKVDRDYAAVNLGIGRRISSGIQAVFESVGEAIFLEDDCLPDPSFFYYCQELLQRYRDTPEVMMITGFNPLLTDQQTGVSYDFTRFGSVWGWAGWKRAFEGYSLVPPGHEATDALQDLRDELADDEVLDYYLSALDLVRSGAVDTWDYQWTMQRLLRGGLCVLPRCNLVENIGFGQQATNTRATSLLHQELTAETLEFPLHHAAVVAVNKELDHRYRKYRIGKPLPDDLIAAGSRLLRTGRKTQLLALANEGKKRYPADRRFAELRIAALKLLGQTERARRESSSLDLS